VISEKSVFAAKPSTSCPRQNLRRPRREWTRQRAAVIRFPHLDRPAFGNGISNRLQALDQEQGICTDAFDLRRPSAKRLRGSRNIAAHPTHTWLHRPSTALSAHVLKVGARSVGIAPGSRLRLMVSRCKPISGRTAHRVKPPIPPTAPKANCKPQIHYGTNPNIPLIDRNQNISFASYPASTTRSHFTCLIPPRFN